MTESKIGRHRLTVGAHYGTRDWLAQRVTAFLAVLYVLILVIALIASKESGYLAWAGLFANVPFKLLTAAVFLGLIYHAWVGVRDIFMDYIKPLYLRILLHLFAIVWLVMSAVWLLKILWRV